MSRDPLTICRLAIRDIARSRWLIGLAFFFAVATFGLLRFSDSGMKALVALSSVVLFIVPLASLIFGVMYLYGAREFIELLLAQPIQRGHLFAGVYGALAFAMTAAILVGVGVPLIIAAPGGEVLRAATLLAAMAALLCAAFVGIATVITSAIEDRVRGLAAALGLWLLLAVVYDGLVLFTASRFSEWPLDRPILALMISNPIDLARVLMLRQFDAGAFLGYTGAVYQHFFAASQGLIIGVGALLLWVVTPTGLGARLFRRRDF
jgi:Cu-processing system permease protein